ncbi:hypothetical protein BJV77DRAFT_539824 [Russula vinacea]|nr:hypothetical protein BJV77DRAFT_539824 [Russula vinacea]
MCLSSYIPFLLSTLVLATPAEPVHNINLSIRAVGGRSLMTSTGWICEYLLVCFNFGRLYVDVIRSSETSFGCLVLWRALTRSSMPRVLKEFPVTG